MYDIIKKNAKGSGFMITSLSDGYKKLFEDANIPAGYRLRKTNVPFEHLSHFVGMKGKNYDNQSMRLLIVGRAVNGWGSLDVASGDTFAENACDRIENEHFSWIVCDNGDLRNNEKSNGGYYWLDKSAFWRVSKKIWESISGNCDFQNSEEDKWTDYVAWTNLYKVAPIDEGNPTTRMSQKQLTACKQILKAEIEVFKPTHIVCITGYQWWFENFADVFNVDFIQNGTNQSRGEKNSIYAEAYAMTDDGIKVVVSCRPERRDEEAYVRDVIGFLE